MGTEKVSLIKKYERMQSISVNFDSKETKSDKWLKVINCACSYSGLTGQKSPWQLADLALKVKTLWKTTPNKT